LSVIETLPEVDLNLYIGSDFIRFITFYGEGVDLAQTLDLTGATFAADYGGTAMVVGLDDLPNGRISVSIAGGTLVAASTGHWNLYQTFNGSTKKVLHGLYTIKA